MAGNTMSKISGGRFGVLRLLMLFLFAFVIQGVIVVSAVYFTVKAGGKTLILPDVVGLEMFTAFNILQKNGLTLTIEANLFPDAELGSVVMQEPKGGTKIKSGRVVSLVVNMPLESVLLMPDLVGQEYSDAMEVLSNNILSRSSDVIILPPNETYDSKLALNSVVSQIPLKEYPLSSGTEIILTVNVGKKESTLSVSNFTGADINSAIRYFENRGVAVYVENSEITDASLFNRVLSQSVSAGNYKSSELKNITLTAGVLSGLNIKTMRFTYSVPSNLTGENNLRIILEDEAGSRTLYNTKVSAADRVVFSYRLQGSGTLTIFYNDAPFESRNVE